MAVSKLPDKEEEKEAEPDHATTVSGRFRSMDELREFMPGMDVKTEGQIMTDKMNLLSKEGVSDPAVIVILEELEELAHKVRHGGHYDSGDSGNYHVLNPWGGGLAS
eukprot:sb/3477685/